MRDDLSGAWLGKFAVREFEGCKACLTILVDGLEAKLGHSQGKLIEPRATPLPLDGE